MTMNKKKVKKVVKSLLKDKLNDYRQIKLPTHTRNRDQWFELLNVV